MRTYRINYEVDGEFYQGYEQVQGNMMSALKSHKKKVKKLGAIFYEANGIIEVTKYGLQKEVETIDSSIAIEVCASDKMKFSKEDRVGLLFLRDRRSTLLELIKNLP